VVHPLALLNNRQGRAIILLSGLPRPETALRFCEVVQRRRHMRVIARNSRGTWSNKRSGPPARHLSVEVFDENDVGFVAIQLIVEQPPTGGGKT
jgi:hypothetical protein